MGKTDIYYGYHGSLDAMGSDDFLPTLESMNINEERKSLEISMSNVPKRTDSDFAFYVFVH